MLYNNKKNKNIQKSVSILLLKIKEESNLDSNDLQS